LIFIQSPRFERLGIFVLSDAGCILSSLITVSDTCYSGTATDTSGPNLKNLTDTLL